MSYWDEVMADSPVGYWRLGEASGTVAQDETANNLNGTYVNTPTLGVAGAISGNTAVRFTLASSEYVSIPDNNVLDLTTPFSVEAWIKRASISTPADNMMIVSKGPNSYQLYMTTGGSIQFRGADQSTVQSTIAISDTNWHHVVGTRSGATWIIYIDSIDRSGAVTDHTVSTTSSPLTFAAYSAGVWHFDGSLDEVAIYPTALSATRVAAHFNPPAGDLVGMAGI